MGYEIKLSVIPSLGNRALVTNEDLNLIAITYGNWLTIKDLLLWEGCIFLKIFATHSLHAAAANTRRLDGIMESKHLLGDFRKVNSIFRLLRLFGCFTALKTILNSGNSFVEHVGGGTQLGVDVVRGLSLFD